MSCNTCSGMFIEHCPDERHKNEETSLYWEKERLLQAYRERMHKPDKVVL